MRRKRSKAFYIDTNVALDVATNRNIQTVLVLERIKERNWKCVSSTFLAMEMADYQQTHAFINKEISKKRNPEDILRSRESKNLRESDFQETEEWFSEFSQRFRNLTLYDFITDPNAWALARDISFNSNMSAPDVIHLTSAILGAIGGYCDIMITNDGHFIKEAEKTIDKMRIRSRLKVMTIADVRKRFFKEAK